MREPSTPPPPHGSRRSDAKARTDLHAVMEAYAEIAGFEVVGVSAIRDDGYLHTLALVGPDDMHGTMIDRLVPGSTVDEALRSADDWGALKYVPHDRHVIDVGLWGRTSREPSTLSPGQWHHEDLLFAPLRDGHGELVAVLGLDAPRDGLVPSGAARSSLDAYTRPTCRAITAILERERLAEEVRLASAAADIVRRATGTMAVDQVLAECGDAIVEGFRAQALWTRLSDRVPRPVRDANPLPLPDELVALAERYASAAWRQQSVGIFAPGRPAPAPMSDPDLDEVLSYLDSTGGGAGSALVVPLGAGEEYLGWLALTRARGGAEWSDTEAAVALDIGRDLGRALAIAQTFEHEHRLVDELRELADYKSHLVATVSHELRTPLTSMVGFLEILADQPELSDRSRSAIEVIQRGGSRLARVVDELLVLHTAADGDLGPTTAVDLAPMVVDMAGVHEGTARQRGIRLIVDVPPGPTCVLGVAHELDHVVANLIGNAMKYSTDGGTVTVSLETVGDTVLLTCSDTGIGIADSEQGQVFEEFFRSSDPNAAGRTGSGLGLAIVRRVVERHGGRVDLESELGRGSTFRVHLPAG